MAEVQGREGDTITLQDVYVRKAGPLVSTGLRPRCATRLEERGVPVPASLFRAAAPVAGRAEAQAVTALLAALLVAVGLFCVIVAMRAKSPGA